MTHPDWPLTTDQERELLAAARAVRARAHAPYSQFQVGAALLTSEGVIVAGCNVENASYGLTTCAERVAVQTAVAAGHRRLAGLAVVTSSQAPPCGACLQVLAEFCDELPILLADATAASVTRRSLSDFLPQAFRSARLRRTDTPSDA